MLRERLNENSPSSTICVKHNISPVGGGDCGVAVADETETVLATRKDTL